MKQGLSVLFKNGFVGIWKNFCFVIDVILLHMFLGRQPMEILCFGGNKEVVMLLSVKSLTMLSPLETCFSLHKLRSIFDVYFMF